MALEQYLRTLHPAHMQQAEKGDTGPRHRDTLLPTMPHRLLLPKQIYSLVAKHQTCGHTWSIFSVKPPHYITVQPLAYVISL